jgi:hypothetical protein
MIAFRGQPAAVENAVTSRRHSPIVETRKKWLSSPNHAVHKMLERGMKVSALTRVWPYSADTTRRRRTSLRDPRAD